MKVALVGSSGYISSFLTESLRKTEQIEELLRIDCTSNADVYLDLQQPESFDYELLDKVDYIIFTAAISGPDQCAEDYDYCWSVNVTGTCHFIKEAVKRKCRTLFFSSDAVFGEDRGIAFTEESETKAVTSYGKMKKTVEDSFKGNTYFKAIRLSYVVSFRDRFVSYCLTCAREGRTAEIFHPFYRNCITVSDVVRTVQWMLVNWDIFKPTFLNVAGRELVSRVRIADEINRYLENGLEYIVSKPDKSFFINRPEITQMKSLYMKQYGILEEDSFTEKIKKEWEELR